jgi:hypothetical protein
MSTMRVWPDDFRDSDYHITGFQERIQTGGRALAFQRSLAFVFLAAVDCPHN